MTVFLRESGRIGASICRLVISSKYLPLGHTPRPGIQVFPGLARRQAPNNPRSTLR